MGVRQGYEPGTFSWVDLSTSDAASAKTFYGELFGWEFEDSEIPGGGIYTMCRVKGDAVAGIAQQDQHPPHWNNYVTVTDVDEAAARAKELGAHVFEEPFDVMEAGRLAVFADTDGAMLCLWEARDNIGAYRVNDVGCMTWNELQTRDPEKASGFYSSLFGWEMEPVEQDGMSVYTTIKNSSGRMNGGFMPLSGAHGDAPSYWLAYFTVESCDGAVEKAQELGGTLLAGPMEPGVGRIAVVSDPQGAVFAFFEGPTDD